MLRWAVLFLFGAFVAAVFDFLGIVAAAAGIANILFVIFMSLFLVSFVCGLAQRAEAME